MRIDVRQGRSKKLAFAKLITFGPDVRSRAEVRRAVAVVSSRVQLPDYRDAFTGGPRP